MMRLSLLLASSFLAGALSTPGFGATITSLNENFDELTQAFSATSAGAFQTINSTNVDIVGSSFGLCHSPESGNCIDMDGTGGNPLGQLQSVSQFAAGTYLLSFDLIGNQRTSSPTDSSVTVTLGNYSHTFILSEFDDTDGIVTNQMVTITTPGNLLFVSNDPSGDQEGELLDNVVVTPSSGVPEPSTFWLLGAGGLGLLVFRARTKY